MYYNMIEPTPEKKKRGRKKLVVDASIPIVDVEKPPPKKRGRKPKGGKIVQNNIVLENVTEHEPNIILHLKCSLSDIKEDYSDIFAYNPVVESIQSYNYDKSDINDFHLLSTFFHPSTSRTQSASRKCGVYSESVIFLILAFMFPYVVTCIA